VAVAAIFLGRGGIDPPGVSSCLVATTIGSSAADACPSAASQQLPTRLGPMVRDATGSQAADPPSGRGGGVLPFSGADVLPLMGMGTLLVAGGILVLSMRRRLMPSARVGLDHEVDIEFRHGSEHDLETAEAD
jgi:hypothetical protein